MPRFTLVNIICWKLDNYSCQLVRRDRNWFATRIPKLQDIWNTILKERVEGFEHRAPQKRVIKNIHQDENDICMLLPKKTISVNTTTTSANTKIIRIN